jgi:hypothetical protein
VRLRSPGERPAAQADRARARRHEDGDRRPGGGVRARRQGFADAADWRAAHERFWNGYLDEIRERLGDPGWSLTDATRVVCQRFRLVERFPEPIDPGA